MSSRAFRPFFAAASGFDTTSVISCRRCTTLGSAMRWPAKAPSGMGCMESCRSGNELSVVMYSLGPLHSVAARGTRSSRHTTWQRCDEWHAHTLCVRAGHKQRCLWSLLCSLTWLCVRTDHWQSHAHGFCVRPSPPFTSGRENKRIH